MLIFVRLVVIVLVIGWGIVVKIIGRVRLLVKLVLVSSVLVFLGLYLYWVMFCV